MNNTTALNALAATPDIILNEWLQDRAHELEGLVAPFRATRCQGHYPLLLLLDDPETRPAVISQVKHLSELLNRLHPLYLEAYAIAQVWADQYFAARPEHQPALRAIHDPLVAARLLDALQLLNNEVNADLLMFRQWLPESFADDPANPRF